MDVDNEQILLIMESQLCAISDEELLRTYVLYRDMTQRRAFVDEGGEEFGQTVIDVRFYEFAKLLLKSELLRRMRNGSTQKQGQTSQASYFNCA